MGTRKIAKQSTVGSTRERGEKVEHASLSALMILLEIKALKVVSRMLANGQRLDIDSGEDREGPVFAVDLLHLSDLVLNGSVIL